MEYENERKKKVRKNSTTPSRSVSIKIDDDPEPDLIEDPSSSAIKVKSPPTSLKFNEEKKTDEPLAGVDSEARDDTPNQLEQSKDDDDDSRDMEI